MTSLTWWLPISTVRSVKYSWWCCKPWSNTMSWWFSCDKCSLSWLPWLSPLSWWLWWLLSQELVSSSHLPWCWQRQVKSKWSTFTQLSTMAPARLLHGFFLHGSFSSSPWLSSASQDFQTVMIRYWFYVVKNSDILSNFTKSGFGWKKKIFMPYRKYKQNKMHI